MEQAEERMDDHVQLRPSMALITITGYPCSGKSKRAQQLKEYLESKLAGPECHDPTLNVVVLSDDNLNLSRSVYDGI
jgi:protein KTI12